MSIDILSALEATPGSGVSGRRCAIQKFIDDIPDDTPGREPLVNTLTIKDKSHTDYRTADQLLILTARLGLNTSTKTIGDHRSGRCLCNA